MTPELSRAIWQSLIVLAGAIVAAFVLGSKSGKDLSQTIRGRRVVLVILITLAAVGLIALSVFQRHNITF